jgi:hypothetical protein
MKYLDDPFTSEFFGVVFQFDEGWRGGTGRVVDGGFDLLWRDKGDVGVKRRSCVAFTTGLVYEVLGRWGGGFAFPSS